MKNRYLLIILLLFAFGCTRPSIEKSNLSISLDTQSFKSKNSTFSSENLVVGHIVINISGPGMSPLFYSWDAKQVFNDDDFQPPTQFSFEVSKGQRLVQVILVYKNVETQAMEFVYGDASALFESAQVIVQVPLATVGSESISGKISGRYLTSSSTVAGTVLVSGPSGRVQVRYSPPNNKPAMLIQNEMMINGWFQFFALSNVELDYVLVDGTHPGHKIFGQSVSLQSNYFKNADGIGVPSHILKVGIPTNNMNEPGIFIHGWFGSPQFVTDNSSYLNGKNVCYSNYSMFGEPSTHSYASSALSVYGSPINYHNTNSNNSFPTTAELISQAPYYGNIEVMGGSNSSCSSTGEFSNFLKFDADAIENGSWLDGHQINFAGPARLYTNNGMKSPWADGSDEDHMKMQLLPGASSLVKSVSVLAYAVGNPHEMKLSAGDFNCNDRGTPEASQTISITSDSEFEFDISSLKSRFNQEPPAGIAFCFADASGRFLPKGLVDFSVGQGGGSGGGGSNNPYMRLEFAGSGVNFPHNDHVNDSSTLRTGLCYPFKFKLYTIPSVPGDPSPSYSMPTGKYLKIFPNGMPWSSVGNIYADSSCVSTITADPSIQPLTSESGIYYMKSNSPMNNTDFSEVQIGVFNSSDNTADNTLMIDNSFVAHQVINFVYPLVDIIYDSSENGNAAVGDLAVGTCYSLHVRAVDEHNGHSTMTLPIEYSLDLEFPDFATGTEPQVYANSTDCGSGTNPLVGNYFTVPANTNDHVIYIKSTNEDSSHLWFSSTDVAPVNYLSNTIFNFIL